MVSFIKKFVSPICLLLILTSAACAEYSEINKGFSPSIYQMQPIEDENNVVVGDDAIEEVVLSIASAKPHEKYSARDLRCLSEAIYYEARGEGEKGAIAVAEVVLNRAKNKRFPSSVCGVVYDKYRNICQFSFVCNGSMKKPKKLSSWNWSKKLAKRVIEGRTNTVSDGALFFHAHYVNPSWAKKMHKITRIGAHSFYRPRR